MAPGTRLRKELTAWDLTVLGVAVVIGAGIFTLTARTVGDVTGPSAIVTVLYVLFAFILVSAGVIVLRRTRPDLPRGFRMPGVPAPAPAPVGGRANR